MKKVKKLNFLCVGAQKAGTSTLHDILKQHPDVSLPKLKETHFFSEEKKYQKGIEFYFETYFDESNKLFFGEIDPEYSFFTESAKRIHNVFSEVKVIFILRNPIKRAFSHYLMTKRRGLETLTFSEAIKKEEDRLNTKKNQIHFSYVSRGFYSKQIEVYQKLFGKSNVKIILFEEFIYNTEKNIKEIAQFIGLKPFNYNYDIKSNPASIPKSKLLNRFIYKKNMLKFLGGKIIPSKKLKDRIMSYLNKKNLKEKKAHIPSDLKRVLFETYYKDEITKLEKICSLNFSSWKEYD